MLGLVKALAQGNELGGQGGHSTGLEGQRNSRPRMESPSRSSQRMDSHQWRRQIYASAPALQAGRRAGGAGMEQELWQAVQPLQRDGWTGGSARNCSSWNLVGPQKKKKKSYNFLTRAEEDFKESIFKLCRRLIKQ